MTNLYRLLARLILAIEAAYLLALAFSESDDWGDGRACRCDDCRAMDEARGST